MRAILMLGHREAGNFVIPLDERLEPWLLGRFKKICVSVNSEGGTACLARGVPGSRSHLRRSFRMRGLTEFGGVSDLHGACRRSGPGESSGCHHRCAASSVVCYLQVPSHEGADRGSQTSN